MLRQQSEQLALPIINTPQEVTMWVVKPKLKKFLGIGPVREVFGRCPIDPVEVNVADISQFADPQLRYALRFAATADAMGCMQDTEYSGHWQSVNVTVRGEDLQSKLISASYTGIGQDGVDTFMEDLRSFAPKADENY